MHKQPDIYKELLNPCRFYNTNYEFEMYMHNEVQA